MKILSRTVTFHLGWTTGSYAVVQGFRLINNVVLARLLAPELFGIMLIVNTLRTGVELLSDIGIGQNIVSNKEGETPEFYNTAWTLQVLRGILLSLLCLAASIPVSRFYGDDVFSRIMPAVAFFFLFAGFQSTGRFLLQKRLGLKKLGIFEIGVAAVSTAAHIVFAYYSPTIWALVYGGLFSAVIAMIGSFFLVRDMRHRFSFSRRYTQQILSFGKWIFLSSIVYFLATNFDRLFLARSIPFQLLGLYGVARSLSDMLSLLVARIGNLVIFPMIAAANHSREVLRERLATNRIKILLAAAAFVSLFVSVSDMVVFILYDDRYRAAAFMLPILAIGIWFSILCTIGESVLFGIARPAFVAISNMAKLGWLLAGLPLAVAYYGIPGAVCVAATADLVRYLPLWRSQRNECLSFGMQDFLMTIVMFAMIAAWRTLFWTMGITEGFAEWWSLADLLQM